MFRNRFGIVSKLTRAGVPCQESGAWRLTLQTFVLTFSVQAIASETPVASWHATADITQTAETFLQQRVGERANRTHLSVASFDSRHRLPQCSEALQGFLRRGTEIQSRTVVGVRCAGDRPWKIYVPVDVSVAATVLVARRSLPKGHLLTMADLREERRDVSRYRSGFISDFTDYAGHRLKAPLLAGKVLVPRMLVADAMVERGQTVTLVARQGGFNISMSGIALSDGALNQRIRVENTHSGRIIEGIVRSREQVEVLVRN